MVQGTAADLDRKRRAASRQRQHEQELHAKAHSLLPEPLQPVDSLAQKLQAMTQNLQALSA